MAKLDKGLILTGKEALQIKTKAQAVVDAIDEAFGELEAPKKQRRQKRNKAEAESFEAPQTVAHVAAPKAPAAAPKKPGNIKRASAQHGDNHAGLPLMPQ